MGAKTPARRVGSVDDIRQPGDYAGPFPKYKDGPGPSYTGGIPAVFFKKPNGSSGHVCSPPHTFVEHVDGSLEIQPSISHLLSGQEDGPGDGWHGHLRPGNVWEEC